MQAINSTFTTMGRQSLDSSIKAGIIPGRNNENEGRSTTGRNT